MAGEFGVSVRSVRRLFACFADLGEDGIAPDYGQCGINHPEKTPQKVRARALQLRRDHPTWGAPLVRIILENETPQRKPPCSRTIQRWFSQEGLAPAPAGRRPVTDASRAEQPHQTWQMDAKERLTLADGKPACWLRVVDEFSGAVLDTFVFAGSSFCGLGPWVVQNKLRAVFSRWGRPKSFRVDNGSPWGSRGDLPPDLALWLIGLEIQMIWNPPHQPQCNGVVERSQGVGASWSEPQTCHSVRELQARLRKMDRIQREQYPSIAGRSRMAAYPELKHSGRSYSTAWETRNWNLSRATEHLAGYGITRRVDRGGKVSIYERPYYVGTHYAGKRVHIGFDPEQLEWIFSLEDGTEIRSRPAVEISRARIRRLDVTNRRNSRVCRPRQNRPAVSHT